MTEEEIINNTDQGVFFQAMVGTIGFKKARDVYTYYLELEKAIKDGEFDDGELETVYQEFKTRDGRNVRIEGVRRKLADEENPCFDEDDFEDEDEDEDEGDKASALSPTALRDKCNCLHGLMQCLSWVVDIKDFQNFHAKPHEYLIEIIQDGIEEIEKNLRGL